MKLQLLVRIEELHRERVFALLRTLDDSSVGELDLDGFKRRAQAFAGVVDRNAQIADGFFVADLGEVGPEASAGAAEEMAVDAAGRTEEKCAPGLGVAGDGLLLFARQRAQVGHDLGGLVIGDDERRHLRAGNAFADVEDDLGIGPAPLPVAGGEVGAASASGIFAVARAAHFGKALTAGFRGFFVGSCAGTNLRGRENGGERERNENGEETEGALKRMVHGWCRSRVEFRSLYQNLDGQQETEGVADISAGITS